MASPLSALVPTIYIVLLGVIREGVSDYSRRSQDKKENGKQVRRVVYEDGEEQELWIRRDEVTVGDIIRLSDGEEFPADCLILRKHLTNQEIEEASETV